jgi:uncharacterized membrane protein
MKEIIVQNLPHIIDALVLLGGYGCVLLHRWATVRRIEKGGTVSRVAHVVHGLAESIDKEGE